MISFQLSEFVEVTLKLLRRSGTLAISALIRKQRGNSERTASASLFFRLPNRRRPRFSAANARPMADNLPPKQQKQREVPYLLRRRALALQS
jgi:hypothetical protein